MTYYITKAGRIGEHVPPDATIVIEGEPETNSKTLNEMAKFFDDEAATLFDALRLSLPQGTLTRLLVLMLRHAAGLYIGPAEAPADDHTKEITDTLARIVHWAHPTNDGTHVYIFGEDEYQKLVDMLPPLKPDLEQEIPF